MATTTKKKPEEPCLNCGNRYRSTRPKCLGDECAPTRPQGVCVHCCHHILNPKVKHALLLSSTGTFLCTWGLHDNFMDDLCNCCGLSVLCYDCCQQLGHRNCCRQKQITFRNEDLLFVHPSCKDKYKLGWLERADSLKVLTKIAPITWLDPKGFQTNNSRRYVAVELELFDYADATTLNKTLADWNCSVVHDGSILREYSRTRGVRPKRDRTFEINTSPACGDALVRQLQEITKALDEAKAQVTLSCGVHVHVDCRDFGYQEIQKLVRVYSYVEEALFAAVHWSRYTNEFCKHCGQEFVDKFIKGIKPDTKSLKPALIQGVYGKKALLPSIKGRVGNPNYWNTRADHYGRVDGGVGARNESRYSAWNLHSYFFRGTVESRTHHGSTDFQEIYDWAKLHVDLFDSIYSIPENLLIKLLEVSELEIERAKELIEADKITRVLNKDKAALGVVVLRSLLPDNTFQAYLDKVHMQCLDTEISSTDILPCQKGKELPPEIAPLPVKPAPQQAIPININRVQVGEPVRVEIDERGRFIIRGENIV